MISLSEDARFRRMIRDRDDWRCRRCGRSYVPGSTDLHAAHGFTRGVPATRYDPDNALSLCAEPCHPLVDSDPIVKRELWIREIGEASYDALAGRAHGRRDRV